MNIKGFVIALTAGLSITTAANAGTVIFTDIKGTWSSPTGASVSYSGNGSGYAKASWGNSTGYGKSAYTFDGASPINVNVASPGNYGPFEIGEFTHNNWPVTGNAITSIKLAISTKIIIDGVDQGVKTFNYVFNHLETTNDVPGYNGTCANGLRESASINANGCADRVQVNFLSTSDTFKVGGALYALDFAGFMDGTTPVTDFWTKERKNNSINMMASVKLVQSAVPEPSTWAMMIIGFGAVGSMARSSRRRLAFAA
ncbi:MAG: hypothetical protein C0481_10060 [Phenylobacterium sp.]|uniref:THxN family PEP-CTERM protein n=1 Tax=Phenylobacterium sp. TaxID=1871053 RepID=UPI0025FFAB3C|nr:THxN family PEP-CTERM protein [Phenylobacterium sp.]MBA4012197.1 hypothetical protein [Phenylobacterium sp.]